MNAQEGLVLSLFPGIGLLDRAFEEEGFCLVRGPDLLWGGDIRTFHPPAGVFGGIIGGPPCQVFSRMRHLNPKAGQKHGNMIPDFERVVSEAKPRWFLMENVPEAPLPKVPGYELTRRVVNNRWCGGVQNRERAFSFGILRGTFVEACFVIQEEALEPAEWCHAVMAGGGGRDVPVKVGGSGKLKASNGLNVRVKIPEMARRQGLPETFLEEAPFTDDGKRQAIGNGVPLPLGRAIAKAVKLAFARARKE
jgi:DNA (cytosine-5)-methyltransferase 1